ncbi:hypothetical protein HUT16_04030 [Kitasatospora sp. NA04385]|uniref:hypothetical protein n=1 Tax=Kitasatospora sp. NA04385 TaxID=2742135 RepID=UPI0015925339|nr:hypothetical protein [Kitasatospora sp. NA04385]QKW18343.1 hypothetical protein HUT16_04030 [Kitasatospora sp. NA04385]
MTASRTPDQQLAGVMEAVGVTLEALARATKAVAAESGVRLGTSRSAVHAGVSAGAVPAGDTPAHVAEALPEQAAAAGPTDAVIFSHTGRTLTGRGHHTAAEQHYRAAL